MTNSGIKNLLELDGKKIQGTVIYKTTANDGYQILLYTYSPAQEVKIYFKNL